MTESICHECVFRVSKSPTEARCKRYPSESIEGMERCVGFRSLDSLERDREGKTCEDCASRHGGLCAVNLSCVEPSMPACKHHHQRVERDEDDVGIEQSPIPGPSVRDLIVAECNALCMMLVRKNDKYGNSALDPVRVFSKADPLEQIRVRLDDKLSRLMRGQGVEDEDVVKDLMGYLVLLRVAKRMRGEA